MNLKTSANCGLLQFSRQSLGSRFGNLRSHRTIVAIFGICAFGEPVQVGSFAAIKVTPYPDSVLNIVRTEVPAEPGDVCLVK